METRLIPVADVTAAQFIRIHLIAARNEHEGEILLLGEQHGCLDECWTHGSDTDHCRFCTAFEPQHFLNDFMQGHL